MASTQELWSVPLLPAMELAEASKYVTPRAPLYKEFSQRMVEAEPVKEVTNKSEASPQSCPVLDEKAATTEEPEVVVQDADDEEEEVKNDSDEEQAEEKLEEYSPITGEDEPNTAFDDDVEADDGDLI